MLSKWRNESAICTNESNQHWHQYIESDITLPKREGKIIRRVMNKREQQDRYSLWFVIESEAWLYTYRCYFPYIPHYRSFGGRIRPRDYKSYTRSSMWCVITLPHPFLLYKYSCLSYCICKTERERGQMTNVSSHAIEMTLLILFNFKNADYCSSPLGLESGLIKDSAISASSSYDAGNVGPQFARWVTSIFFAGWGPRLSYNRLNPPEIESRLSRCNALGSSFSLSFHSTTRIIRQSLFLLGFHCVRFYICVCTSPPSGTPWTNKSYSYYIAPFPYFLACTYTTAIATKTIPMCL